MLLALEPAESLPLAGRPAVVGTADHFADKHTLRRRASKRELKHLAEVDAAAKEIERLPDLEESIHAIMRENFHAWDLVPGILQLAAPITIEALIVATLGYNARNAGELLRLIDERKIGTVTFLCSHYFAKSSPAEFEILRAGLEERGQRVAAQRTHAKVIGKKLTDGRCLVVETSANLRSCHNVEQLCLTQSPDLFEFHRRWISEVSAWTTPARK